MARPGPARPLASDAPVVARSRRAGHGMHDVPPCGRPGPPITPDPCASCTGSARPLHEVHGSARSGPVAPPPSTIRASHATTGPEIDPGRRRRPLCAPNARISGRRSPPLVVSVLRRQTPQGPPAAGSGPPVGFCNDRPDPPPCIECDIPRIARRKAHVGASDARGATRCGIRRTDPAGATRATGVANGSGPSGVAGRTDRVRVRGMASPCPVAPLDSRP